MRFGLNLRLELIDDFLLYRPPLSCLEIIAENFFTVGGHHRKLEQLRRDYDISLHCLGMNIGGVDPLDTDYLSRVKELARRFQPIHISDHLSVEGHDGRYFHDLLPFPLNEDSLANVCQRTQTVQDYLGEPLLLENLSYYIEYKDSTLDEAEFLNAVCADSKAKILLDFNNIVINQANLGHSAEHFLATIDWSRVAEIHLAGATAQPDELLIDCHNAEVNDKLLRLWHRYKHRLLPTVPVIYERDNNLLSFEQLIVYSEQLQRTLRGNSCQTETTCQTHHVTVSGQ